MPRLKSQPQAAPTPTAPPIPKAALSVEEAAEALGMGRTTAFKLIAEGKIRSFKLGKRRMVPADEPAAFVARLQQGA